MAAHPLMFKDAGAQPDNLRISVTTANQIDGYSYDAAGNLMNDGSHSYYYDAEHHLAQVDGTEGWCQSNTGTAATACYTYDAEGRRVRRTVPGSGITDDYLYDLAGNYITQVSGTGWWIRGELYAGGRHLGTYENDLSTPTTFFNHTDHLGTERVETNVSGSSCETITSLPLGDGLNISGSCDPSAKYFTGKERDWESNLDNFGARYNSSQVERFMIPDPFGGQAASKAYERRTGKIERGRRRNPAPFRFGNCRALASARMIPRKMDRRFLRAADDYGLNGGRADGADGVEEKAAGGNLRIDRDSGQAGGREILIDRG
ncbi:MAG TPA: hypothetical protein VGR81_03095 [Candidatus Acidoferrales bacterium]|nr:hypothetical protein [Candidatus Acidoferrales bacterium]